MAARFGRLGAGAAALAACVGAELQAGGGAQCAVAFVTDRRNRATDVRHIGASNRWVNGRPARVTPRWILQLLGGSVWVRPASVLGLGRDASSIGSRRCDADGPGWRWRAGGWPGRPEVLN